MINQKPADPDIRRVIELLEQILEQLRVQTRSSDKIWCPIDKAYRAYRCGPCSCV